MDFGKCLYILVPVHCFGICCDNVLSLCDGIPVTPATRVNKKVTRKHFSRLYFLCFGIEMW